MKWFSVNNKRIEDNKSRTKNKNKNFNKPKACTSGIT